MKFHRDGVLPENGEIFVFGSNLAGRHGAGAAREAYQKFGAKMGKGWGLCGQSFAFPTKNENIITMDLFSINAYVEPFKEVVEFMSDREFFVTRLGCGLAGYRDADIAPLFKPLAELPNISFAEQWEKYLT
jgi:hypothetical protein